MLFVTWIVEGVLILTDAVECYLSFVLWISCFSESLFVAVIRCTSFLPSFTWVFSDVQQSHCGTELTQTTERRYFTFIDFG